MESRVFDAALAVYSKFGWSGFNFDVIARAAGVGKGAIYRRWKKRADLLNETLKARWEWVNAIDTGSLHGDLIALARMMFDAHAGPFGDVGLHLRSEPRRFAELRAFTDPYKNDLIHQGRGIVRRAINRGEVPGSTSPGLIMDVVVGAVINHVSSTPDRLRSAMIAKRDAFITDLVNLVLAGVPRAR
jgi:AcrR family transcriptional regulator